MSSKAIVLDTNILIRAVLGKRVRELIVENADAVHFFAPDVAANWKWLPVFADGAAKISHFSELGQPSVA